MIKLLVFVAVVLAIIAIVQLIRVFELAIQLRGVSPNNVTEKDNRMNGNLYFLFLLSFFAFCIWQVYEYKDFLLPVAASEHGVEIDWLFDFNMIIITIVFVLTHILLCYFAWKYYGRENAKAAYYPHNDKLELLWTIVPAIVMAVVIIFGLKTWNKITELASDDAIVIEVYSRQFDWTARYAGSDNELGMANYKLIGGSNFLGLDTNDQKGWDDIIVKGEFHIPKGKEVEFKFRSQDVLHSAYMPHFRAQMNTVPGMTTMFHFTPTITTDSMRMITGDPEFNYILLCNKICGASHYNMQMDIIVDEPEAYEKWLSEQKTFKLSGAAVAEVIEENTMVEEAAVTAPAEMTPVQKVEVKHTPEAGATK